MMCCCEFEKKMFAVVVGNCCACCVDVHDEGEKNIRRGSLLEEKKGRKRFGFFNLSFGVF